jgi:hypothetical protein
LSTLAHPLLAFDAAVALGLGLPVIDVVQMTSASHAGTQANVYPIQMEIVGSPIIVNVPRAIGANLAPQGILALIGGLSPALHTVL